MTTLPLRASPAVSRLVAVAVALAATAGVAVLTSSAALAQGKAAAGRNKPGGAVPDAPAETRLDREAKAASEPASTPPQAEGEIEPEPKKAVDMSSFEGVARAAVPSADLGTLLSAFVEACSGETRELDKIRCHAVKRALKKDLPNHVYIMAAKDPAVVNVSEYDARIKGYSMDFAGCLACTQPVTVGHSGDKRFVTLRSPSKEADSLPAAVGLLKEPLKLQFESIPEAKTWLRNVRPHLRAEFVFQPVQSEWSFGVSRGYAFKLLAGRIYDRCTGDVLFSRPPSTGQAERIGDEEGCPKGQDQADATAETRPEDADLQAELTKADIDKVMGRIKGQIYACFQQFEVPGRANITFEVASNGMVQTLKLSGVFEGTPTGDCIKEAAKNARFPRFKKPREKFSYPFFLR